jgi:hypothetical protein
MSKGQKSNREAKKPKKAVAPKPLAGSISSSSNLNKPAKR